MPAPVSFNVTIGALPPGFSGDPQAFASAIAARLTVTPSEPWSAFINSGAMPSSNVGPWLKNGLEWWVWSDASGTYVPHAQNGSGVQGGTLAISSINGIAIPKTVLTVDASGTPAAVSGTPGQVLTAGADGTPGFAAPATGNYFTVRLAVSQTYNSNGGTPTQVQFGQAGACAGVVPDVASYRVPVTAGSVWFFRASAQVNHINGVTPDWQHSLNIRPYQDNSLALGGLTVGAAASPGIGRSGVQTSGVYAFGGAGFVDVAIFSASSITGPQFQVDNNGANSIFSGFRIL